MEGVCKPTFQTKGFGVKRVQSSFPVGGGVAAKDGQISHAYLEVPKIRITAKEPEFPFGFLSTIGMSITIPSLKSLLLSTSLCFPGEQCFSKE